MSVIYNTQYVDEKYSPIVEPNLYYDSVLQPGVTFTDKYTMGQAGGYFVHKLGAGSLLAPTTPAGDFSGVVTADSLIQIVLNNAFRKEENCPVPSTTLPLTERVCPKVLSEKSIKIRTRLF